MLVFLLKLSACADYKTTRTIPNDQKQFYSSSGFVLIYEDNLYDEKIVNRKLKIKYNLFHQNIVHFFKILKTIILY